MFEGLQQHNIGLSFLASGLMVSNSYMVYMFPISGAVFPFWELCYYFNGNISQFMVWGNNERRDCRVILSGHNGN